ncbi:putative AMFR protein [Aulographum hederae CBS 113979]|uniref:Coupling of ubiquitin conjugation to ER degradation protein 1 n=1 Tax=Aulographum hederae CBS 113979 TaxID=1176131 RepID=A0A6G1GM03_9PEZI|nr:putative AMFR protein [Aulographum hederae CBS 113979]
MSDQSLNIPQLVVVLVLGFLAVRWYLARPATSATPHAPGVRRSPGHRVNPALVEQVAQMFPQLSRRDIMWNLSRNGGSVAAVTERHLSGRGLETPPLSFQSDLPPTPSSSRPATTAQPPKQHPDLITRYNLASKISQPPSEPAPEKQKPQWSQSKAERQLDLQRRREEMILNARRKMEEKDRLRKAAESAS